MLGRTATGVAPLSTVTMSGSFQGEGTGDGGRKSAQERGLRIQCRASMYSEFAKVMNSGS